jgi:CO/xanthine dehydrogenase FAD-binding subunit
MRALCYEKPASAEAIVKLLGEDVALLAGGTDLLAQIRSRLVRPALLVDIKGAEELRQLRRGGDGLSIGAAVFLNRLLEERDTLAGYRALTQAVADLASYPIRNRATLVGNVANASPCADTVPPLVVMDARVELRGPGGAREVPVTEFITGNRETTRAADELVTRVIVPPLPHGSWSGFRKRKRVRGHDLALASAALLRDPERRRLRLSVGSCSPRPVLVELDDMFDNPDVEQAVHRCQGGIQPIDDVRASIEYRRDMVAVMVHRLFAEMSRDGGAA